jgi:acyl carrier protein
MPLTASMEEAVEEVPLRSRLTEIFRSVFDEPALEIYDEMTARDVEEWDSLTHINLIVAVEKAFSIRFTTAEVTGLANVGEFMALIRRKLP